MNLDEYAKRKLEKQGKLNAYDNLIVFQGPPGPIVRVKGYEKKFIQLASNDYLGLAGHPEMIEFGQEGTEIHGTGTAATRPLVGTLECHIELEEKLTEFKDMKGKFALAFQGGYSANVGAFSIFYRDEDEIDEPRDLVISDSLNHRSIIEAIVSAEKWSRGRLDKAIYGHLDMNHLEEILKEAAEKDYGKICVVTDGVFSMLGEIAPLHKIVGLVEKYKRHSKGDIFIMVDDAHATGVLGQNGRGTPEYHDVEDKIDILVGTLSKANGVVGGYVLCSKIIRDYLVANSPPTLFSATLPGGDTYAVIKSLELMKDKKLREKMWRNSDYFKKGMRNLGYYIGKSITPITPAIVGSADLAKALSKKLRDNYVIAVPILHPMVAEGEELVRNIVTAAHTPKILDQALEIYKKVGKELSII